VATVRRIPTVIRRVKRLKAPDSKEAAQWLRLPPNTGRGS
jgi:hypothetical protein